MLWTHRFFLVIVENPNIVRVPIAQCEYDPTYSRYRRFLSRWRSLSSVSQTGSVFIV